MIGDEDHLLLEFMARHRVVIEPQLRRVLGGATAERLAALERAGLVRREAIFAGEPPASWITARGLGAVASPLPSPRSPDLRSYRHDVGAGWLWLAARDGAFGELLAISSERELRSRRDGVRLGGVGPRGGERLHYPDLVLEATGGATIALELELTVKSAARLDAIMRGYAFDARIAAVLYLVPGRAVGTAVGAAADRAGVRGMIQVQRLSPGSPEGVPSLRRAAGRSGRDRSPGLLGHPTGKAIDR